MDSQSTDTRTAQAAGVGGSQEPQLVGRREVLELAAAGVAGTVVAGAGIGQTAAKTTSQTDDAAGSWPMDGFDGANTRFNPAALGPTGTPEITWKYDVDIDHTTGKQVRSGHIEHASPTVHDGTVYFGHGNTGSDGNAFHAVDAANGRQQWRFTDIGAWGDNIRLTAAVADGLVFVSNIYGELFALQTDDGSVAWSFEVTGDVYCSPKVVDGTLYLGDNEGTLYAMDPTSGVVNWTYDTSAENDGQQLNSAVAVVDGTVYVTAYGLGPLYCYAIDAPSGEPVWKREIADAGTAPYTLTAPTVTDGTVIFGDSVNDILWALDADTGEWVWRHQDADFYTQAGPAIAGCTVYAGTDDGRLLAVDLASGETRWTGQLAAAVRSAPVVANGTVYVGDHAGQLSAFDAVSGDRRWATRVDNPIHTSPRLADGALFVASTQRMYRFDGDVTDYRDRTAACPGESTPTPSKTPSETTTDVPTSSTTTSASVNSTSVATPTATDAGIQRGFFSNGPGATVGPISETMLTLVGIAFSVVGILYEMIGGR